MLLQCLLFNIVASPQEDQIAADRHSESKTAALTLKGYLQTELGLCKDGQGSDYTWHQSELCN